MEFIELKTEVRADTGKGVARKLRSNGKVPAVLYGPNTEPVWLSVGARELERVLKKGNIGQMMLDLVVQNGDSYTRKAMIKELQVDPLSREFLHVDFYEVDMNRKIRVMVPVTVTGKSKGVELGGMLQIIRRELEILCYPADIPESIELDITDLNMGDSIHVKDIQTDGNIEIPAEVNFTVVTVIGTKGKAAEEGAEEGEEGAEAEAEAESASE